MTSAPKTTAAHAVNNETPMDPTKMLFKSMEVAHSGKQITLPEGMSLREGREWLYRKEVEENQVVGISEMVDAYPLEGAYAFAKAIAKLYGFAANVPTPGFFGDTPPMMISVETGVSTREQVPWGSLQIPGLSGTLQTSFDKNGNRFVFNIIGEVRQKDRKAVAALAEETRRIVRDESIYRGKAIRVFFPNPALKEQFSPADGPKFIDTRTVREEELIFSDKLRAEVTTSVFTPITRTNACRAAKIPLKRGVLLSGPYGVGKTLTANVVAKKCEDNGWTFLYLTRISDLKAAIHFAKAYEPAVIFAEDIDRIMESDETGSRSEAINDILNTIDGVDTKGMELITILTTNYVEQIEPAMMRPGRLDAVIQMEAPDAKAVLALLKLYGRGLLDAGDNYSRVGQLLSGQIPAVIREVIERSKLAAVSRSSDSDLQLRATDLEFAAEEMLRHVQLMTPRPIDARSDIEKAAEVLGAHVSKKATTTATTPNGASVPKDRPSQAGLA